MKYVSQFKNIYEEIYNLEIITNNDTSQQQNVELASDPVIVNVESDELYKPCKYSTITVRLIQDSLNFDFYNKTAQGNKIILKDSGNNILFIGYLTPNLYDMGFESDREVIELEGIDSLATLKYYSYTPVKEKRGVISFLELIRNILKKCNSYNSFYISTNKYTDQSKPLIENLIISEQNFFDESDDAMKFNEVLEEVCKFLNVTCIADGDSVYFLDYDAIKNGINTYYKYSVDSGSSTTVTLNSNINIAESTYSENGTTISLDDVYNKVTVQDSLYSFDSAFPDYFDNKYLTNKTSIVGNEDFEAFEVREQEVEGQKYKIYSQYFVSNLTNEYWYNNGTSSIVPDQISFDKLNNELTRCGILLRQFVYKVEDYSEEPTALNFDEYILINSHNWPTTNGKDYDRKYITISTKPETQYFSGGNNMYFIISGSIKLLWYNLLFSPEHSWDYEVGFNNDVSIKCMLKLGDNYFDGEKWVKTESTFNLVFDTKGEKPKLNTDYSVKNNIDYTMGLDSEGFSIKLPEEITLESPEFTIYEPQYVMSTALFKNLKIDIKVADETLGLAKETPDTDTEYFNIINEDYVNEYSGVSFKICTWDNKLPNYSCVVENKSNGEYFLDKVHSQHNNSERRMEEHYIDKITNQYSTPSIILNLNQRLDIKPYSKITYNSQFSGKYFVPNSYTLNYSMKSINLNIIEKK